MQKIKILLADDHSVVRAGLRALFKISSDFLVIGEASDGEETISLVSKYKPDIVLLDISMPKMNGIEATKTLKEINKAIKILILTIHEEAEYIQEIIRAGADGYVLKSAEKREIFAAIRAVASGERFFSPDVSRVMIDGFIRQTDRQNNSPAVISEKVLSKRELEILGMIAKGYSSLEIAEKLFLSVNTINTHRNNIMRKLGVHEIAGLVRYAIQNGIAYVGE